MTIPKYLKVDDIAEMLQLSRGQAYELMKRLPLGVRAQIGKQVRVNESALLEWLAKGGSV